MHRTIAMIPARMGSQRLAKKNLRLCAGLPLITRAIRKCKRTDVFDEIWVNSESDIIGNIALKEGVGFHKRPEHLADNNSTSEQFVYEFLKHHQCTHLVQVHSIAPLLQLDEIREFTSAFLHSSCDILLAVVPRQIECICQGNPVNFSFQSKTNSQELDPVNVITWSLTGWRRDTYLTAYESGGVATYAGAIELFPMNPLSAHVIKTKRDLELAERLLTADVRRQQEEYTHEPVGSCNP